MTHKTPGMITLITKAAASSLIGCEINFAVNTRMFELVVEALGKWNVHDFVG